MITFLDNITDTLKMDLEQAINKDSKISIAASCFSIFAFDELKKQLSEVDEFRFIFTSPTFISEKTEQEHREFYIPRLNRERNIYGTEFEVKLRNELSQKSIAIECAQWIKQKATFKSNTTTGGIPNFMHLEKESNHVYLPLNGFTTSTLGCDRGNEFANPINKMGSPTSESYLKIFDSLWQDKAKMQDVTDEVIRYIEEVYKENSAEFIYFVTLYNIFNEFLNDISADFLPNEAVGFKDSIIWGKLFDFQKTAVEHIITKLEKYNGCILADSVGLGKTFTALAVIKYYESRNRDVLVLCPKKLGDNWNTYKENYINNPLVKDKLRYDVLYHTDISRTTGSSNGKKLDVFNWASYDLIVIDESHNFRNGGQEVDADSEKQNRYQQLMNKVIRAGVKTKVLMLSATPVNNRFNDLKNQLELAYEGNTNNINKLLNTQKGIDEIFKSAQAEFNKWGKLPPEERTTENLLGKLDFDFFEVLDSVTIARSRKHIEKHYNTAQIGKFPKRLKPISLRPPFTLKAGALAYNEIYDALINLNLSIYTPSEFIHPSAMWKYFDDEKGFGAGLSKGREKGIKRLMSTNLLKRLESSVYAFRLTTQRIKKLIDDTIVKIDNHNTHIALIDLKAIENDLELDDQNTELFSVGKRIKIELDDMNYLTWREELDTDSKTLEALLMFMDDIYPKDDKKLHTLFEIIKEKIQNPINEGNKKIIIFSAFSDTAEYLYNNVSAFVKDNFGLNTALITGSVEGKTTCSGLRTDLNSVLTCFSPISKEKKLIMPNDTNNVDILIATDCISEGQNLQDCDFLINYDIHWNPVRIIQRFGRIDRIGSKNNKIQLVNFWPDMDLDDYIHLKSRVETRMRISVMTSTGDDDLVNESEKGELEYRTKQLQKLQEEVVDLEDMNDGISIMDLGLGEFRADLLDYIKTHGNIDTVPFGIHAVTQATKELGKGVIYVLKNINKSVDIDNQNRLHPFYMVYIAEHGEVLCNHLQPKKLLDIMRLISKGNSDPKSKLYKAFNKETKDGKNMSKYSKLLSDAISSIIGVKEDSELDSFFGTAVTTALSCEIKGLSDFELICFLVIK